MATEANSISLNSPMSGTHFTTAWNSLIDDLDTTKYGKLRDIQASTNDDDVSETSNEAYSNTSQYHVTDKERKAVSVRGLDHHLMSDKRSPITWNYLVDGLETAKYGRILEIQSSITESKSETSSQASTHPNSSQCLVTASEHRTVRTLDHQRCFVTNESGDVEVAHLLDNSNAGNGQLMDALRGLGIVHDNFNLGDISNLLLMSRNLHFLWKKYAAFIIVPSTDTRKRMLEILINDRECLRLALINKQVVEPHQLAYPELVTYDIILVRPSLFGNERSYFQRTDNHDDDPTYYKIPTPSKDLHNRLEYLTKQDDEAHVSEFLNIEHVTGRSSQQAIKPYLMAMNALPKFKHWHGWAIGDARLPTSVPDSVFTMAFKECRQIVALLHTRIYGVIHMSRGICDGRAQGCKGDYVSEDEGGEKASSASSRDPAEEPESPPGSGHLQHNPLTQPGTQSWISRGNFDKMDSLESWRQEVMELGPTVQALNGDLQ